MQPTSTNRDGLMKMSEALFHREWDTAHTLYQTLHPKVQSLLQKECHQLTSTSTQIVSQVFTSLLKNAS